MYAFNFWHKLYLLSFQALILFAGSIRAQSGINTYLQEYDRKTVRFGFTLGAHTSAFNLRYAESYQTMDTLHSVMQPNSAGVNVGMLVNYRITDNLHLRSLLKVGFYEHELEYNYTDGTSLRELRESTFVELPLLVKFQTSRSSNSRFYTVAGITPGFNARGLDESNANLNRLPVQRFNLMVEAGFGMNLYYQIFILCPEIRFSTGVINALTGQQNRFSEPLQRLTTHAISLYFHFE